jgi:Novel STAND NTPase 2
MRNWPTNPYYNKATIRELDMFIGRRDLLRQVYEMVAHRQSASLVGPRGIGKSSLLWYASLPEIQAHFPFDLSRHIFVFLDLREYLQKTCEDFFQSISKAIITQGAKSGLILQMEGLGEDAFSNVLDQVAEQDFFPVLLLDAFDKVTLNKHFDLEFFEFLRAQASMGLVSYVTASIAPLYEVCHRGVAGSPFFNIFYTYTLEALTDEEAWELITTPAKRVGKSFTEADVALVLHLAGQHPFFIQRVCYVLFEEKLSLQGGGEIDEQRFKKRAYNDLLPHFEDTWGQLSEEQHTLLRDEAQQKGKQQRELCELSESALFRQFVRNTCQTGLFRLTITDLEDALDNMHDLKVLGEANLRLMKAVTRRLNGYAFPSIVEKGVVIREVLYEAFERLRSGTTRNDSSLEWRFYNILYYRYFKHHMKHEQIVARLGISSLRKYYRERRRAIEALLNILFEMERTHKMEE